MVLHLAPIIRDVGTWVAFVGTLLSGPDAVREIGRVPVTGCRRLWAHGLGFVTRRRLWVWWLGFLTRIGWRKPAHHGRSTLEAAGASSSAGAAGPANVWRWSRKEPVEVRVEWLRERTEDLDKRVADVDAMARREQNALWTALTEVQAGVKEDVRAIRERMEADRRRSLAVNARGLPVVGAGILLSGFSGWLGPHPWFGVSSLVLALPYTLMVAIVTVRPGGRLALRVAGLTV